MRPSARDVLYMFGSARGDSRQIACHSSFITEFCKEFRKA